MFSCYVLKLLMSSFPMCPYNIQDVIFALQKIILDNLIDSILVLFLFFFNISENLVTFSGKKITSNFVYKSSNFTTMT